MTKNFEFNYGAALVKLINCHPADIRIHRYSTRCASTYIVNKNTAVCIKYCTKRLSPWLFVFPSKDGMVILNEPELKALFRGSCPGSAWLSASRGPKQQYVIKSSQFVLNYTLGKPDLKKRMLAILTKNPARVSAE